MSKMKPVSDAVDDQGRGIRSVRPCASHAPTRDQQGRSVVGV